MSEQRENEMLFKRVRLFAWATIAAAVLVVPLSMMQTAAHRANSDYNTFGGTWLDATKEVIAFISDFVQDGVVASLYFTGLAVIALLVLRIAADGSARPWAPALSEGFKRKVMVFTTVTIVYALVYALIATIETIQTGSGALHDIMGYYSAEAANRQPGVLQSAGEKAGIILVVLVRFFILVTGAHVVRILLTMTPSAQARGSKPMEVRARE